MDNVLKGTKVIVRDHAGKALIRILWEIGESVFYICSERQYPLLVKGDDFAYSPIGFSKHDVFQYDDAIEIINQSSPFNWEMLEAFDGEKSID